MHLLITIIPTYKVPILPLLHTLSMTIINYHIKSYENYVNYYKYMNINDELLKNPVLFF